MKQESGGILLFHDLKARVRKAKRRKSKNGKEI
jgi:hypothetical protein